jgi:hypothetical protein
VHASSGSGVGTGLGGPGGVNGGPAAKTGALRLTEISMVMPSNMSRFIPSPPLKERADDSSPNAIKMP